ncbi:MAG: hypothetical protein K2I20_03695 [Clostridia bacterium]|nr:hypothetical protein [Clostridia bacterium]
MTEKPYLKYKNKFKLNCLLTAASSLLAVISVLLLLFVPSFQKSGEGTTVCFSLFDEALLCFNEVFGGTSKKVWDVYQVVSVIYLAAGCVFAAVVLAKCVSGLFDLDKYCAAQYAKITSDNGGSKGGMRKKFNVPTLFVSGVVLEVLYMIMLSSYGAENEAGANSLFASANGVTGFIALFIISFAAYVAVAVFGAIKSGNLKAEIMREN